MTVHIAIGNSDNRLTQRQWGSYWYEVDRLVRFTSPHLHGAWLSASVSPYQNACWGFELEATDQDRVRTRMQGILAEIAGRYSQDSIAWNESETVFVAAVEES